MKMNLPNKLTVLRALLIPVFLFFLIFPWIIDEAGSNYLISRLLAAAIFGLASFTDMLDGKIARKYNLVTNFGKFLDPLADKLMVFGAMIGLLVMNREDLLFSSVFGCVAFVIILRELAVTSMRMVVSSSSGVVIAANIFGKMKTVSQIIGIVIIILEPLLWDMWILSFVSMGLMVITTIFSGITYFKAYWPYLNTNQ